MGIDHVERAERTFVLRTSERGDRRQHRQARGEPVRQRTQRWRFVGSDNGDRRPEVPSHFTATCRKRGVNPWALLKATLTHVPTTHADQLAILLLNSPDQKSRPPRRRLSAAVRSRKDRVESYRFPSFNRNSQTAS